MKALLATTTALVLSVGVAHAEVSLGGSANFGLKYDDGNTGDTTTLHYELDFSVIGSGTTDGGLTFGASIDLDTEIDSASGDPNENDVKDPEVFISGAFGTLTAGDVDPATDGFGISDAGFDGIGLDDDAESRKNAGTSANLLYEYVIGDFSFLASTHTIDNDFGVAVTYNLGGVGLGLGYAYNDGTDESSLTLDVGLDFGAWLFGQQEEPIGPNQSEVGGGGIPLSTNLILSDNDVWGLAYGIDFVAGVGPATDLTFVYGGSDTASEDSYGIGVEYDLGGGAALAGGIGEVDGDVVADFGITMSF